MTPEQQDLFEAHQTLANGIARGFCIPGEGPELVLQETLRGLQKAATSYDAERGGFEPFAKKVIINHLRSTYRSSHAYRQTELTVLDEDAEESPGHPSREGIADWDLIPSHEAERNEIRSALNRGLGSLTPGQREVLEHFAKGGSFAELARTNGISEQAVRQMFERGVQQIRPRLESLGVTSSQFMPALARLLPDVPHPAEQPRPKPPPPAYGCARTLTLLLILVAALVCFFFVFSALPRSPS